MICSRRLLIMLFVKYTQRYHQKPLIKLGISINAWIAFIHFLMKQSVFFHQKINFTYWSCLFTLNSSYLYKLHYLTNICFFETLKNAWNPKKLWKFYQIFHRFFWYFFIKKIYFTPCSCLLFFNPSYNLKLDLSTFYLLKEF